MEFLLSPIVLFFIVVVVFGFKSFIVVPQQEVYVVERLGRFSQSADCWPEPFLSHSSTVLPIVIR